MSTGAAARPVELLLQLFDFLLLLFDGIEHRPQNRIVVDLQIAAGCAAHSFGQHALHGLGAEADVFALAPQPQRVIRFVFVTQRLQLPQRLQTGRELALIFFSLSSEKTCHEPPPTFEALPFTDSN